REAMLSLPPRERKVISMYYFGEVTMKEIGAEIGVNESRVSQLHARAIQRLRKALIGEAPAEAASATSAERAPIVALGAMLGHFKMAKAQLTRPATERSGERGVVLNYKRRASEPTQGTRPQPTPGFPARRAAAR
ncbi:MAG: sigma-70 family RNA polymerase sigma factor, partial [Acidobacteriota bacterium]